MDTKDTQARRSSKQDKTASRLNVDVVFNHKDTPPDLGRAAVAIRDSTNTSGMIIFTIDTVPILNATGWRDGKRNVGPEPETFKQ